MTKLDELCINTIRFLSVDGVEKARSGHPGAPMGTAPIAYTIWTKLMNHNPQNPRWANRDRFVLSMGHASMLLYSMLHLTGYDMPLDELKNFRQWGSLTPGHPEYAPEIGIETTTGPLGQGFGNAVGMAIAESYLAARFNTDRHKIVDHHTYVMASDGDLMEGVSAEAASLAGHLGLGKLIVFYDSNRITIEGETDLAFTEDVGKRFEAYGWQVLRVDDGNDIDAIEDAAKKAQSDTDRPSLIIVKTHIGYGSPKQDLAESHGAPLGAEAVEQTKKNLGWPLEPMFFIPEEALAHFRECVPKGEKLESEWQATYDEWVAENPELASEWEMTQNGDLPEGWENSVPTFAPDTAIATRNASGKVLNAIAEVIPNLVGGSADLAPSNKTELTRFGSFQKDSRDGRNFHFGVREHGMAAIMNGMALHGGLIVYGGTFLVFSDYMRAAMRIAALSSIPVKYVLTHDSIGVGEDGPTHQPVEHINALRVIPNMIVLRPADANETAEAWKIALERRTSPCALILTRQNVPVLDVTKYPIREGVRRGGYVISDCDGKPDIILIGTGSEVSLALEAQERLAANGVKARVVSMPSFELFDEQPEEYRKSVLPDDVELRLAVEAGTTSCWYRWIGSKGRVIGIDRFGASAPGNLIMEKFGFTVSNIVANALEMLAY